MALDVGWSDFAGCCRAGLSYVRRLRPEAAARDPEGWNFGPAWPPSLGAYGRMRALIALAACRELRPASMLEIAAGDGALGACLAATGCRVVANDLREANLRAGLADFDNGAAVTVAAGNVFDLDPQTLGTFDLVAACEVIEHVAHPLDLLRHLARLTRPGGHLLLTTPNGRYFRNRLPTFAQIEDETALEARQFRPDADGHLFLLTPREVRQLAAAAGWEVVRLEAWGWPLLTGHGRLSRLQGRWAGRPAYRLEQAAQRLPARLQERFAFNLTVICRRPR